MKKVKYIFTQILIVIFIIMFSKYIYATDEEYENSYITMIESSKKSVASGEEFDVYLKSFNDSIFSYYGAIEFDNTKYELLSIETDMEWDLKSYNEETNLFLIESSSGEYEKPLNNIIATFKFKALEESKIEGLEISTPVIDGSEGDYEYDENIKIDIGLYLRSSKYKIGETKDTEIDEYKEDDKYISRVSPLTTIDEFINNLDTNADVADIKIKDKNGIEITDKTTLVGTGMKLYISKEESVIELSIAVTGDTDGNSEITITDFAVVNEYILKLIELKNEYFLAADVNEDNKITITDFAAINEYILKLIVF